MPSLGNYEYALGLTSQFLYCGLPIRLDTYSKCQFGCSYCFAKSRGGNFDPSVIKTLRSEWLKRKLERALGGSGNAVLDDFIRQKIPFHLGGMSDPFPFLETTTGITKSALIVLADLKYPTVISSKGTLFARDDYLEILSRGRFVVQFSVTTSDPLLHSKINIGTPALDKLFGAISRVSKAGVPTVCRIQPALPQRHGDVLALASQASHCGVRHVAVEHLKLAMENHQKEASKLSQALGYDVLAYFKTKGARRSGREWILPISERLEPMLQFRRHVHALGMTFGAADTDLLHISDGNCCCNGTDLILKDGNHFSYTMNEAIRRADKKGFITYRSIENEWRPSGSVKRYVNSKCRNGSTIEDHLKAAWNKNSHGPSLTNFVGVTETGEIDSAGMKIYHVNRHTTEPKE